MTCLIHFIDTKSLVTLICSFRRLLRGELKKNLGKCHLWKDSIITIEDSQHKR